MGESRCSRKFTSRVEKECGSLPEVLRLERLEDYELQEGRMGHRGILGKNRKSKQLSKNSGIVSQEVILFTQTPETLDLSVSQRQMLLSSLCSMPGKRTTQSLMDVSARLFGSYTTQGKPLSIPTKQTISTKRRKKRSVCLSKGERMGRRSVSKDGSRRQQLEIPRKLCACLTPC